MVFVQLIVEQYSKDGNEKDQNEGEKNCSPLVGQPRREAVAAAAVAEVRSDGEAVHLQGGPFKGGR